MVAPTKWTIWQNQMYKAARPALIVWGALIAKHLNDTGRVSSLWDWSLWDKDLAVVIGALLLSLVSAGQRFSRQ